ncbi:hypothetical protein FQZ97_915920 [compost metagenome]
MRRHQACLVALDGANAVPLDRGARSGLAQGQDLLHTFLDVVLTKSALARRQRLLHRIGAKGLGNRQQGDGLCIAPSLGTGPGQALVHLLEIV